MRQTFLSILICLALACGAAADEPFRASPIFGMIEEGDADGVRRIVESGFELDGSYVADGSGFARTPLGYAIYLIRPDMVKLLIELGADPNIRDLQDFSGLDTAIVIATADLRRYAGESGREDDVEAQALENVDSLLAAGARVNTRGRFGWTPLGMAAAGSNERAAAVITKKLLERGALPCYGKLQPIFWALSPTMLAHDKRANRSEIVRLLLDAGADANARAEDGTTPLHAAAAAGDTESAKLLVARGADPGARDDRGRTPASVAYDAGWRDTADLLRSYERQ